MSRNTNQRLDGWAIKNGAGEFLALDETSGGYPYVPETVKLIHIWPTEEAAQKYKNVFSGGQMGSSSWKIVRVVMIEV